MSELPRIYICNDGFIIWYGLRGENKKLTYQTYSNEKIQRYTNSTIKQMLDILKEGVKG